MVLGITGNPGSSHLFDNGIQERPEINIFSFQFRDHVNCTYGIDDYWLYHRHVCVGSGYTQKTQKGTVVPDVIPVQQIGNAI